jgi:hypothetical protein
MVQQVTARADAAKRSSAQKPHDRLTAGPRLTALLLFAWACMIAGGLLTRFPEGSAGSRGFWILVGSFLLWRIYRAGSYLAWAVSGVLAFTGAVMFSLGVTDGLWQTAMCALSLGHGLPLLTRAVRDHVG